MEKLLNVLNELVEKYKIDEADVNKIRKAVYDVETGESALDGDMAAEDFVAPEEGEDDYGNSEDDEED